jgi:hypothetical protein
MNKKKIIGLVAIVLIVAISASVVNSFCSTKEVLNSNGLRVDSHYIINDTGNTTQITDPKTQKYISIKNSGTFDTDYNEIKDNIGDFNAEKDKPNSLFNQTTLDGLKASLSEINVTNGIQHYKMSPGGLLNFKTDVYNINGKTGYASYGAYPTIDNSLLFNQLVIN